MKSEPLNRMLATASIAIDEARTEFVRRSRAARQHRIKVFGTAIAREVPWDILLVLYMNHEQTKVSVSSIHADVIAPQTTVLRWLNHLESEGFVERWPNPTDQRISFIGLSTAGKCTLDLYFDTVLAAHYTAS